MSGGLIRRKWNGWHTLMAASPPSAWLPSHGCTVEPAPTPELKPAQP